MGQIREQIEKLELDYAGIRPKDPVEVIGQAFQAEQAMRQALAKENELLKRNRDRALEYMKARIENREPFEQFTEYTLDEIADILRAQSS